MSGRPQALLFMLAMSMAAITLGTASSPALAQDPAEAPTGMVRVQASQAGAQIYIDNELAGPAPLTRYLPIGSHTVRVVADNFSPFVRKITVQAGTAVDVQAQLLPGDGTVEFQVSPPSSRLVLNEREAYPLPVRLTDIPHATYNYRVEAPGHESVTGSFDFTKGKNLFFALDLLSSAGIVEITTLPEGATVILDNTAVGKTPLKLADVAPGPHTVRLDLEGQSTALKSFDNSDGNRAEINVRLKAEGGTVIVKSNHDAATVKLNGLEIGTGKKVVMPSVARGRYELSVSAPGATEATGRAEIPDRGRATFKARLSEGKEGKITALKPIYLRWTFWTAVGLGAGGATTGGIVWWKATEPIPIAEGDVSATLP